MCILILIICSVSSLELQNSEHLMFISSILPKNVNKNDSLKDVAKKAYKTGFDKTSNTTSSDNDSILYYPINNSFNMKLKTGFMFHDLKFILNSSLVKAQITYLTYENKMNMKLYKELNNNLCLSLSEEKSFNSELDRILFNLSYKF